jgi:branched-chain amino acid transport system permease protein
MTGFAERAKGLGGSRNLWLVPALILLGIVYPFIEEGLSELPLIGDFMPSTGTLVVMIAFTMMAVGLNIVVGYCGLLDLGYVAFYAVGAYTAGWLASSTSAG